MRGIGDANSEHFVVVQVGAGRHLFALNEVREVLPMLRLADVERACAPCRGIAQVRGQLMPVFDAAGNRTSLDPSQLIVVLDDGRDGALGVAVDDVIEVALVLPRDLLRQPDGSGSMRTSVNLRGEVLQVLSAHGVAHGSE